MSRDRSTLTGAALSSRVAQWTQPGIIKSIQRGTITIANASLTNTATITSVDVNNTRLVCLGNSSVDAGGGGSGAGPVLVRIDLTNATTITASRTASTDAAVVSYEVVEYWPGVIRTIQRGTITAAGVAIGQTALATTLQTVTKATMESLGLEGSTAFAADSFRARMVLTNTTTVTMTRIGTSNTLVGGYQVTEWY